jgi:hypothetical protein
MHLSDQYSVFGTRVISSSPREALYVLDGLVENNTILRPVNITPILMGSPTTSSRCLICWTTALCRACGISPINSRSSIGLRERDGALGYQTRSPSTRAQASFGKLDTLIRGTADAELIAEQWDQLAWVAASLKSRTAFCPPLRVVKRDLRHRSEQFDRCPEYSHAIADDVAVAIQLRSSPSFSEQLSARAH